MRIAQVVVLIAIVVASAWWLVQDLDWAVVSATVASANPLYLLGVVLLLGVNHVARSLRIGALIEAPIGNWDLLRISAVAFLAIQLIPFRLGEFVRPQLLVRHGVPFGEGLGAIAVDRVLDILMLLGLMGIVAFVVPLPANAIEVNGIDVVAAGQRASAVAVTIAGLGMGALAVAGRPIQAWVSTLPWMGPTAGRLVSGLVDSFQRLGHRPASGFIALAWSMLSWTSTIALVWAAQHAFPAIPTALTVSLVLWTSIITAMSAVHTPGFFGTFEAASVAALALFGTDPTTAKAFALVFHLVMFAFAVAIAVGSMLSMRLSFDDLRPPNPQSSPL